MLPTVITVDVYCVGPEFDPAYRIFVDDDLLTERSWIWPSYEVFIREHIEVEVDPGTHKIQLINCGTGGKFNFKNVTVNNTLVDSATHQEYTFKL